MLIDKQQSKTTASFYVCAPFSCKYSFFLLWPSTKFKLACGLHIWLQYVFNHRVCVCVCLASDQCRVPRGSNRWSLTSALRPFFLSLPPSVPPFHSLSLRLPRNRRVSEGEGLTLPREGGSIGGNGKKCGWSCQQELLAQVSAHWGLVMAPIMHCSVFLCWLSHCTKKTNKKTPLTLSDIWLLLTVRKATINTESWFERFCCTFWVVNKTSHPGGRSGFLHFLQHNAMMLVEAPSVSFQAALASLSRWWV